jgi:hypothetical protein
VASKDLFKSSKWEFILSGQPGLLNHVSRFIVNIKMWILEWTLKFYSSIIFWECKYGVKAKKNINLITFGTWKVWVVESDRLKSESSLCYVPAVWSEITHLPGSHFSHMYNIGMYSFYHTKLLWVPMKSWMLAPRKYSIEIEISYLLLAML